MMRWPIADAVSMVLFRSRLQESESQEVLPKQLGLPLSLSHRHTLSSLNAIANVRMLANAMRKRHVESAVDVRKRLARLARPPRDF